MLSSFGYAQTRYLSATGTDAGDCSLPGSPCATITYAVSQANDGDSVLLAPGNYSFATLQTINKPVVVSAANTNNKPVITSGTADVISVAADNARVHALQLNMGLTATSGLRGLVLDANADSITVSDCEIVSTKLFSTGVVSNAYAILAYGGQGTSVHIYDNEVRTQTLLNDAFGHGISLGLTGLGNAPGGQVEFNEVQAFRAFETVTNTSDLRVNDNQFTGISVVDQPWNNTEITLEDNIFSGSNPVVAATLFALLDVHWIDSARVNVRNNEFNNYVNIGLFSSAARNVHVVTNNFKPATSATNFTSIHANSKLMTTGTQANAYENEIEIKGNTFGVGVANNGTAILFADHYGSTTPAFKDSIIIGGPASVDKNVFTAGFRHFVVLDSSVGNSSSLPFWQNYTVSIMRPFAQDVYAYMDWNNFPTADTAELEDATIDVFDNDDLGNVIYAFDEASINENDIIAVSTFPNPTVNFVNVQLNDVVGNVIIKIVDAQGKVMVVQNIANAGATMSINVEHLRPGPYVLFMKNKDKYYNSRFIKQ